MKSCLGKPLVAAGCLCLLWLGLAPAAAQAQTPLEAARGIGDYLVKTARHDGQAGVYWAQYEGGPEKPGYGKRDYPLSFYSGAAGTGYFLLNLYRVTGEKRYLDAARGVGERLLSLAKPLPGGGVRWKATYERKERSVPDGDRLGLYTGNAGMGLFLQYLAEETKDERFRACARKAFERIEDEAVAQGTGCYWDLKFLDIIGGEAGIGVALLQMHQRTGEKRYLETAARAARWLVTNALKDGKNLYWKKHGYLDPNFSHGTAGLAFFLSGLKDAYAREAALAAATWVEASARPSRTDGLHWQYYAGSPPKGKHNWVMNSWCHGAPGTIRLFLRLYRLTGEKRFLDVARKAGAGIRHDCRLDQAKPFFYNPTYCCGAAGCMDAFLRLYGATKDPKDLADAEKLATAVLQSFRNDKDMLVYASYDEDDRKDKKHPYVATGFMLGNAGMGFALLSLHAARNGLTGKLIPFADHPNALAAQVSGGGKATPAAPAKPATPSAPAKAAAGATAAIPAGPASTNEKNYVILTSLARDDDYYEAVLKLKKIHRKAKVLAFPAGAVEKIADDLRKLEPRFVAVVLKPEDLDVNFQSRFLTLCTRLDSDPFCDFSYGYVTGATAEECLGFVKAIARAWKKPLPKRVLSSPAGGGTNYRLEQTALRTYGVDWPMVRLSYGKIGGRDMTDEEIRNRLDEFRADYKGNGVIMMGGHGIPNRIAHGISGADIRAVKLDMSPAVVYNYACFTGCVSRAYRWARSRAVEAKTVPKDESIALAILNAGVSAYIASIEPRPAGPGMGSELTFVLNEGATLGEGRRREYDQLALGFISWGEDGLVVPRYVEGEPRKYGRNPVKDSMMMSASGAVLFGDPAYRMGPKQRDLVRSRLIENDDEFVLECTTCLDSYIYAYDVTRLWSRAVGMAVRLYVVVDLPEGVSTLGEVEVKEVKDAQGRHVETKFLAWAIERKDGRHLLHVRVSASNESGLKTKGTRALFRITRGPHAVIPRDIVKAEEEAEARKPGNSPVAKTMDGPWKYAWRNKKFKDILRFVESFMEKYGKGRGMKIKFEFDDDARAAAEEVVTMELDGEPLKKGIDRVCGKLGLKYTVDEKKNVVRFSRK